MSDNDTVLQGRGRRGASQEFLMWLDEEVDSLRSAKQRRLFAWEQSRRDLVKMQKQLSALRDEDLFSEETSFSSISISFFFLLITGCGLVITFASLLRMFLVGVVTGCVIGILGGVCYLVLRGLQQSSLRKRQRDIVRLKAKIEDYKKMLP